MTIEIREMTIKTVVTDRIGPDTDRAGPGLEELADQIRADILADCRDMVRDLLEEMDGR